MLNRRETLQHGCKASALMALAGIFPLEVSAYEKTAFEAKNIKDALKALGFSSAIESKDVSITGPEIADNGANVLFTFGTTLPNVKRLLLLVEKNPSSLVANFQITPAIESQFSLRVKMNQSSDVYAVALTQDGKAYFAKRDVKVTIGGCGD